MTSKEIVDGADVTIIAELDEAAEARIIDVLSKVFVTNKYPGLRAAILDGAERYKQQREIEEKQRQYEMVEKMRFTQMANSHSPQSRSPLYPPENLQFVKEQMEKHRAAAAKASPAPGLTPFERLTGFGKKPW